MTHHYFARCSCRVLSLAALTLMLQQPVPAGGDESMPSIESQTVMFYYKNVDAPAAFYGETLGLEMTFDSKLAKIFRVSETSSVGGCPRSCSSWPWGGSASCSGMP